MSSPGFIPMKEPPPPKGSSLFIPMKEPPPPSVPVETVEAGPTGTADSPSTGSTTIAGLGTGLRGMQESFGGAMQMVGSMTGVETLKTYGDKIRKAGDVEAEKLLPKITKIEDVRSPADFLDYLTFTIGQTAPSTATSMGGALAGMTAGAALGGPVGAVAGRMLGAGGVSWILNAGQLYADLIEEGYDSPKAAAAAGLPMAALDAILPFNMAGRLWFRPAKEMLTKEVKKRTVGAALKAGAKYVAKEGLAKEGLPELGQELIAMGTETAVTEKVPAAALSRALNAMVGGTIGGTAFSGGVDLYAARRRAKQAGKAGERFVTAETVTEPEIKVEPEAPAPQESAADILGGPSIEPTVVQTSTVPLMGPPAPAIPSDVQKQVTQAAMAEAMPPSAVLPEMIEPSPALPEVKITVEPIPGTESVRSMPAQAPEPITPQELATSPVPETLPVTVPPLDRVVERLREAHPNDPQPPSVTTTFLEKPNQWYASVSRETPSGRMVAESVYAPTEEQAKADLAAKLTDKLDLFEAQDANMEAMLEASLSGKSLRDVLPSRQPTPAPAPSSPSDVMLSYVENHPWLNVSEIPEGPPENPLGNRSLVWDMVDQGLLQRAYDKGGAPRYALAGAPLPEGYQRPKNQPAAELPQSPPTPTEPIMKRVLDQRPFSHETGLDQLEEIGRTGVVPDSAGGEGISYLIRPDVAMGTPGGAGAVPAHAIDEIVVNSSALPSPVGVAKARIYDVAKRLNVPVRFLGSKKQVTYYLNERKLGKDLERIRKKSSEAGFLRLDMGDLWSLVRSLGSKLQESVPEISNEEKGRTQDDMVKFGKFSETSLTLLQIAERNPEFVPMQKYLGLVRKFWTSKTKISGMADKTLRTWNKIGREQFKNLSSFLKERSEISFAEKRRLGEPESRQLAVKHRLSEDAYAVSQMVDSNFDDMFRTLEENLVNDSRKRNKPAIAAVEEREIRRQFEDLRNRNYFPVSHFGTHTVVVRAKDAVEWQGRKYRKGQLVEMSSFETDRGRNKRFTEAEGEYPADRFDVKKDLLSDSAAALRGFPSAVFKALAKEAELTTKDVSYLLEEEQDRPSETNLVKSLKRGRTALGFSGDTQRTFANFFAEGSNYVARMEHRWDLANALEEMNKAADAIQAGDAEPTRQAYYEMQKHYNNLMNPGNDWAVIRGWLFPYFFVAVPKQAIVNLTQVPMLAYPYLAATYGKMTGTVGDVAALREIGVASKQVARMFDWESKEFHITNMEPELLQAIKDGTEEGFLNESYATEVAGIAHGNLLRRFVPNSAWDYRVRQFMEWGTAPFKASEQYDRHVTFVAAFRLGKKAGLSQQKAYEYARGAVEKTMFEYARWNKPKAFRGKAGVILAFKMYQQGALYFYGTQPGRGRALGIMLAVGGLMGLPLADDALEILSTLGTLGKQFFGMKNPLVDLKTEARELIASWHMDPDTFMNGLSRSSFGLHKLGSLVGVPIPSVDLSPSIQLGRIVPGLQPLLEGLQGTAEFNSWSMRFLTELSGVGGSVGMNAARAITDDSTDGLKVLKYTMPAFVRNMLKVYEFATRREAVNSNGQKLVDFDLSDVNHQTEILAQLLGLPPTRLNQMQERKWAQAAASRYYNTRRELMFNTYSAALATKEQGEIDKARVALREYNVSMPPQYRITGEELLRSVATRNKNEHIQNQGLPTQKRYIELYRNLEKAYPVPTEDRKRQAVGSPAAAGR